MEGGLFGVPTDEDDLLHQYFRINRLSPDVMAVGQNENREPMKLDCLLDSHDLNNNSNSKISNLACSNELLVCGTFEGGYILVNPSNNEVIGEHNIANNVNGITNHIVIDDTNNQLIVASNDKFIRLIDLNLSSKYSASVSQMYEFPFAINCVANNQRNLNEILFTGDDTKSYIIDKRQPQNVFTSCLIGHEDYGFSCDWSPTNENLILTGNQDGSVKLWDRRMLFPKGKGNDNSLYSWDSSLGRECCAGINIGASSTTIGGPVRNAKFSTQGDYISWAESLDHIGIIPTEELLTGKEISRLDRIQSIEFIGKCTGLSFAPTENGYGEELIIGVNDNPLGGILSYRLGSKGKSLDFDFHF